MFAQENILPYAQQDGKKNSQIKRMFDNIAHSYDTCNHLMSWTFDRFWRNQAIKQIVNDKPQHILDVATGTGDFAIQTIKMLKRNHKSASYVDNCNIIGVDISSKMMEIGKQKVEKEGLSSNIKFIHGDCLDLPYDNNSFDVVISAFGIRNFSNLEQGLREMHRVLKSGGKASLIELTQPIKFPIKQLFSLYSHTVIPFIGKVFSRDIAAYRYLVTSIESFPQGAEMMTVLKKAGFSKTHFTRLTGGMCTMYCAIK